MIKRLALVFLAFMGIHYSGAARAGGLIDLDVGSGVTQPIYIKEGQSASPAWVAVLFAGGDGALALDGQGVTSELRGNFVIRTRHYWSNHGDLAVLVDTPSDQPQGMSHAFRQHEKELGYVKATVAYIRRSYPQAKVALVSTSAGTVTVANVVQNDPALADAYVLTSPLTQAGGGQQINIYGLKQDGGKYRVLVVSNEKDQCIESPARGGRSLAQRNGFAFIEVSSDKGLSMQTAHQCGGGSPHGFRGIEHETLDKINAWLTGQAHS